MDGQASVHCKDRTFEIWNPHSGRLNRLQKRIICQLAEADFNTCRAYNRFGSAYMEIIEPETREQRGNGRVTAQRKQAVVMQTGVRYIWNAICGRLFADKIDPDLTVGEDPAKIIQLRKDLKVYKRQLRDQRPIFIGHNLLWDLCFLHGRCIGSLPECRQFPGYCEGVAVTDRRPQSSPLVPHAPRRVPAVPSVFMALRCVSTSSLLDVDDDSDGAVAGLVGYEVLKLEALSVMTPAPSTEEAKPVGPAKVPPWGSVFWKRYGYKSRAGPFGFIFFTSKRVCCSDFGDGCSLGARWIVQRQDVSKAPRSCSADNKVQAVS